MSAMIQNDEEKEWMLPLLELRNELDVRDEDPASGRPHLRDFRRMNGSVQLLGTETTRAVIHGPYTQEAREMAARAARSTDLRATERSGADARSRADLACRSCTRSGASGSSRSTRSRTAARIYECTASVPGAPSGRAPLAGRGRDGGPSESVRRRPLHFEMTRELLDVERRYRTMSRRAGLYDALEKAVRRGFYADKEDAVQRSRQLRAARAVTKGGPRVIAESRGLNRVVTRLGTVIGGQHVLALRAPFLLLAALLPWLTTHIAGRWFGEAVGWRAGSLFLLMPLAGSLGILALPDVPMAFATVLCLDAGARLLRRDRCGVRR